MVKQSVKKNEGQVVGMGNIVNLTIKLCGKCQPQQPLQGVGLWALCILLTLAAWFGLQNIYGGLM